MSPQNCIVGLITNTALPIVSGPVPADVDDTLTTDNGHWSVCAETITGYQYAWLRNGVVIPGATGSSYTLTTADVGTAVESDVEACDVDGCSGFYHSSNYVVPVSQPPDTPWDLWPNNYESESTPTLESVFSDPDPSEVGYVSYSVYRASDNARVATGSGPWAASGEDSDWTPSALPAEQLYYWVAQAGDASESSGVTAPQYFYVNTPASSPQLQLPATSSSLFTTTPVLSASATDAESLYFEFQVASDQTFSNVVADSGWVASTGSSGSWTVTPGALQRNRTYYWRARAEDIYAEEGDSNDPPTAWTATPNSFTISPSGLGANSSWPIWSHGPVSVNEANGNLVLSLPTPSYPTATGSLTFSLAYNSQAPASESSGGLGQGWTLAGGDGSMSPPLRLIDHSVKAPNYQGAEIDWPDGSADSYSQAGTNSSTTTANTYLPASGDGSQLTHNPDGTWTMLDSDGTMYTFGTESSGVSLLTGAETAATKAGHGILSYTFNSNGSISQLAYKDTTTSSPSETLNFAWGANCNAGSNGDYLCVSSSQGQTWVYTANSGQQITGINDGTRQLLTLSYGSNGLISELQNANDLDPTHASPGYNSQHSIQLTYDANSPAPRVKCVIDGPTSNQTATTQPTCAGGSPAAKSTWSFTYHPGGIEPTPPRASHYGYLVRNAGPAAYYPLDETSGTSAVDASGNGNNATYSGTPTLGQPGALAGSGGGTAVNLSSGTVTGSAPNLDLAASGYNTVEMWINWNGTDNEMPFSFGTSGIYDLWFYNGFFGFNSGAGDIYGTKAPSANTWHYVVAEFYNGAVSGSKLWIDGVPQSLSQVVGSSASDNAAAGFNISGDYSATYRFTGSIDEVALYNYPLSSAQIEAHFAEGAHAPAPVADYRLDDTTTTAADSSGNGNNATYSGSYASATGASGVGGWSGSAVNFTGGTVSGSIPNLNTTAGGYNTVAFWMDWGGQDASGPMPFGFSGSGGNYDLEFDSGFFGFNTGAGDIYGINSSGLASSWHYVVAEFYNGRPQDGAKLWIDGAPQTLSIKLGTPLSTTVSSNFDISGWPHDTGYRMGGEIDELAIYNTALTSGEISNQYATNAPAGNPNLGSGAGTAAGYTTLTAPNQQNASGDACPSNCFTTYYDSQSHPTETIDTLGHTSESGYSPQDQLLWTEDAAGNPTDYLYGGPNGQPSGNPAVTQALLQTIAPDPDNSGPLPRPVTNDRYDEKTAGSTNTPGAPLTGLAATYWNDVTLTGQPSLRENDPAPDSTATSFSLPFGGSWPISGASSARWSGDLTAPSAGDYTFTTLSDGGTRLTIDGADAINNWTTPTSPASSQPIHLNAGPHQIVLDYTHSGSAAQLLTLEWQCTDCSQPINTATAVPLADLAPAWLNQTSTISPAGRLTYSHYADPTLGEPDYTLTQVGGSNLITSYTYDDYGRQTGEVMPSGNSSASINSNGTLSGAGDPTTSHYGTTNTYYGPTDTAAPPTAPNCSGSPLNQSEQLKSHTPHGEHGTTYVYDLKGNTLATTTGAGTTCSTYNNENRLTSTQAPGDSAPTSYTYDPSGAQLTATGPSGTVTSHYDEQGRLVDEVDSNNAEAKYTYDADGNQLTRTAAKGSLASNPNYTTSYSYNAANQLTSETDPASHTYSYFYDNRGNLRGTQYPNSTFNWVDTNPDGWTSDQYNRHGTINSTTTSPPTDSNPLADYTYTYNLDGKRTSETRTSGSTSQTTTYSYDNLGRLSQVGLPTGTTCRQYTYDADSNRSTILNYSNSGCTGTPATTTTYTYDPTNSSTPGVDELTKTVAGSTTTNYGYTNDGQTSSQGTTTYTWDGWNRIKTATVGSNTVTYTYDPTGALKTRASSSPSTTLNYLLGDLFETNASGTITTSYTDAPAGNLASYNGPPTSTSTPTYLYYDAHGNLAAEANTSGTITGNHTYDPFGAPTDTPLPSNTTTHRFVGRWDKQYDTTTGLVLMGARPYDPTTGRFLSNDPIPGGSLNNYDYAGQDPVNGYDLAGTMTDPGGKNGGVGCYIGGNGYCTTDTAVDDCSYSCAAINTALFVGPGKLFKIAKEEGVLAKIADSLFARGTGKLNSNDVIRLGRGWKGSAQGGKTVFRLAIGNKRANVRILGREIRIHWHIP